jgi:hypothetical protein
MGEVYLAQDTTLQRKVALSVALVIRNSRPNTKQVAQHGFVCLRSIIERFKMFARDHQHMHRRLRIDIANHHATLILMHKIPRCRSRNDPAKQTTLVLHTSP